MKASMQQKIGYDRLDKAVAIQTKDGDIVHGTVCLITLLDREYVCVLAAETSPHVRPKRLYFQSDIESFQDIIPPR
jgi:hypothetical protein